MTTVAAVYVAPAARPLTELHIPEDGWLVDLAAGVMPSTRCGLPMAPDELWVEVPKRRGDRVCRECGGELVAAPGLWLRPGGCSSPSVSLYHRQNDLLQCFA